MSYLEVVGLFGDSLEVRWAIDKLVENGYSKDNMLHPLDGCTVKQYLHLSSWLSAYLGSRKVYTQIIPEDKVFEGYKVCNDQYRDKVVTLTGSDIDALTKDNDIQVFSKFDGVIDRSDLCLVEFCVYIAECNTYVSINMTLRGIDALVSVIRSYVVRFTSTKLGGYAREIVKSFDYSQYGKLSKDEINNIMYVECIDKNLYDTDNHTKMSIFIESFGLSNIDGQGSIKYRIDGPITSNNIDCLLKLVTRKSNEITIFKYNDYSICRTGMIIIVGKKSIKTMETLFLRNNPVYNYDYDCVD